MKIVHLSFSFETGGMQTLVADIASEQCRAHRVWVIVVNANYEDAMLAQFDPRVRVVRLNRQPGSRNPLPLLKLQAWLLRIRPDAIHCHNNDLLPLLGPFRSRACLTVHDLVGPERSERFFPGYRRVFAISEAVRSYVDRSSGVRSQVIYNGVNSEKLRARPGGGQPDPFRLLQVSRLVHTKKGQHILLRALADLVHTRGLTHLRLDFIGEGESDEYLKALTDELGLRPYVRFLGLRDRAYIYERLSSYHLLAQPSLYEGFGLTVAEGMAAGVPVLVADLDGPREIIGAGQYGWSFPAGDARACADRIAEVVDGYATVGVRTKVDRAQRRAQDVFDVRQTARQYVQQYTSSAQTSLAHAHLG
jgi:glycosyltransferase involved in cell wall biosynthesis